MHSIRQVTLATLIGTMLLGPLAATAANKPLEELQRDISQMQEDAKALRSSLEAKIASLQAVGQQTLDTAGKTNANVGSMNTGVTQALQGEMTRVGELSDKVVALSVKLENASNDISDLRSSVEALVVTANKQQQTLSDLINLVKLSQTAPPPPPPAESGSTPVAAGPRQPTGEELFNNAVRDMNSGSAGLALNEFGKFLELYPGDPSANLAQYQIAEIHYGQRKLDEAAREFDAAIRLAPKDLTVVPDAYLRKGLALLAAKKRTDAIASFRAVVSQFPRSPQAAKAKDQLASMHVGVAPK